MLGKGYVRSHALVGHVRTAVAQCVRIIADAVPVSLYKAIPGGIDVRGSRYGPNHVPHRVW